MPVHGRARRIVRHLTAGRPVAYTYGTAQTERRRMRRVVLWASQRTEVLALIKTTTDLNVRDFRWTVAHSQKTARGMEVARLEYAGYGRHHFFQFDRHQGQHYAIYTAGNDGNVEEHFPGTWE